MTSYYPARDWHPFLFAFHNAAALAPTRFAAARRPRRMATLARLDAALLIAVGVGSAAKALMPAPSASTSALPRPTISIEDLHGQLAVNSLPAQEVREPF
jgi:hypothetical protein